MNAANASPAVDLAGISASVARTGASVGGCRSATPRSALLAGSNASGTSAASVCARSNSRATSPASSSISISWIGARRTGPASAVRTSPASMHSSAIVLSGNASGIVVRTKSVVKRGASPCCSARPSARRNGVVANRSGSSLPPATGHSNSERAATPPPLVAAAGPLTVCTQRRPSRRSLSAMPAAASARSSVS